MKITPIFESLYSLLVAFTLTNGVLINIVNASGFMAMGQIISSWSLAITTIISTILTITNNKTRWVAIMTTIILALLVVYQLKIDLYNTVDEYTSKFLINGVAGLMIGLSIRNIDTFFRYISYFSILYLLILIGEPINHALMKQNEMVTGYLMSTLVLVSILSYFTVFKKNIFVLILSVFCSFTILFFCSRGCGLTIILAWLILFIWNRYRLGISITRSIFIIMLLLFCGYWLFNLTINYILSVGISFETGSLLEKISSGYANSYNGRDEIWSWGMSIISKHGLTGIGFGGDRVFGDFVFIHNIFLELLIDFGIPLTIIILFIYWRVVYKGFMVNKTSYVSALIIIFVLRYWVQLLFSSSYLDSMLGLMFIIGLSLHEIKFNKNNQEQNCRIKC